MGWIKKSLIYSLIWTVFLIIFSLIGLWFISTHSSAGSNLSESQRSEHLGSATGFLLSAGLILIWLKCFVDSRKDQSSQLNNPLLKYLVTGYKNKLTWVWVFALLFIVFSIFISIKPHGESYSKNEMNLKANGIEIRNANPSFGFLVPRGFDQIPAEQIQSPYLYGFFEKNCTPNPTHACLVISLSSMGGIIDPQEPINENERRAGTIKGIKKNNPEVNPTLIFENADVLGFKMPVTIIKGLYQGQSPIVSYEVELPLKYDAVILGVIGAKDEETKVRSIFNDIVISLKGDAVNKK